MLGDDMTLGAYSARILSPGATEMGVHVDYPYWAMRGPFVLRPPLMVQVILMLQDFTEENGATLVAPRSQLRCARPNPEQFAREAVKIPALPATRSSRTDCCGMTLRRIAVRKRAPLF